MVNQWYVVHTYSGHEDKVKKSLEMSVDNLNMRDVISQILVPIEEVVEIKQNKKRIRKRKLYPGYVFVEMTVNNTSYWLIKSITGVTDFLGGVKPVPMANNEVDNLLNTIVNPDASRPKPVISFDREENVRIIEGPFKHFIGIVEDVNQERGKLRIMVTIFGRLTPVELDYLQVEKL